MGGHASEGIPKSVDGDKDSLAFTGLVAYETANHCVSPCAVSFKLGRADETAW